MILSGKLPILAVPVVMAAAWPFTATETLPLLIGFGSMVAAIIGAFKSSSAKAEAKEAKLAVNGHLAKLEKEQDKAKSDRDAEFNRLLQVVKDASRAEGEEIARKAAELLAIKVAEGVAQERAKATAPAAQPTPAAAPAKRIDAAIEELTDAAEATSVAADTTTDLAKKHPR